PCSSSANATWTPTPSASAFTAKEIWAPNRVAKQLPIFCSRSASVELNVVCRPLSARDRQTFSVLRGAQTHLCDNSLRLATRDQCRRRPSETGYRPRVPTENTFSWQDIR